MFSNDYKNKFGKTYYSSVYEKAQATNKWTYTYTLLYALSKNGMKYATDKTGPCSLINKTSLGCVSSIQCKPTDTSGELWITFKRMRLVIRAAENDKNGAMITGIYVTDTTGKTLATMCKYDDGAAMAGSSAYGDTYGGKCTPLLGWTNNPDTDEDWFSVKTLTFKDSTTSYDCCAMHLKAKGIDLGHVIFFKAKNYFSSDYKYGFVMKKGGGSYVAKFSDDSKCKIESVFDNGGKYHTKIAKLLLFVGTDFVGLVGNTSGAYTITTGEMSDTADPGSLVSVNGCLFCGIGYIMYARLS